MKKVVFLITNLNIGGAERVLADTVNKLPFDVTVLTLYGKGDFEKEFKVKRKTIFKRNIKSPLIQKIIGLLLKTKVYKNYLYKKYIKDKYDVEVAFLEGPMTEILSVSSNPNKYAFVHTDLDKHFKKENKDKVYDVYSKFKAIVFSSKSSMKSFNKYIENKFNKKLIHNYIDDSRIKNLSKKKIDYDNFFLYVGRFRKEKGVLRLIEIFKKRKESLIMIGDGPLYNEALGMVKDYPNIILLGALNNPYPYIKRARALIMPSYYEGYPTVAREAAILNTFVISTNTGAKEALENYPNKVISDDIEKNIDKFIKGEFKIKPYTFKEESLEKIINLIEGIND